ncbi:hypothetical protein FMN63_21105 [Stappia sp. BW2]|uniref:hypothetical protein n=1 Tax=Stappia sp. BW2 TaxID=2592622 RepID=UPI0011DEA188|nr:hypothetical protein [Stappia sp. BW2]TYC64949.1 hypothetical protein FMN63_21105 [Stappia sp. BW2]
MDVISGIKPSGVLQVVAAVTALFALAKLILDNSERIHRIWSNLRSFKPKYIVFPTPEEIAKYGVSIQPSYQYSEEYLRDLVPDAAKARISVLSLTFVLAFELIILRLLYFAFLK